MTPIKVLLADDHQIVLDGILSFLDQESEIEVVATANDGQAVLEHMREQTVDVAVLDIGMPLLDGLETAKHILRDYPNTKVLMLTVHGDANFIINAMKLGIHGYLLKEKSKEALVGAIHCVYRGSTYWSPELIARISDRRALYQEEEETVKLTQREKEVLCLMVAEPSYTSEAVGKALNIAKLTVDTHVRNMLSKLKLKRRTELVAYAMRTRLCGSTS